MWGSYSSLAWAARAGERRRCVCAEGRMLRWAVTWEEVGEEQRSQMDVFLMRGLFTLPNWAPAQQHCKPVGSTRMLTPPLVQLPRPLLCHQHVAPLGAGDVTEHFAHGQWRPHLPASPAGSPVLVTPGHCSLLALCWTNPAVPKLLMEKRERKVRVANMLTNHFGWWSRALWSLHSSTTSLNIWWSWNLCTEMQMLVETSE